MHHLQHDASSSSIFGLCVHRKWWRHWLAQHFAHKSSHQCLIGIWQKNFMVEFAINRPINSQTINFTLFTNWELLQNTRYSFDGENFSLDSPLGTLITKLCIFLLQLLPHWPFCISSSYRVVCMGCDLVWSIFTGHWVINSFTRSCIHVATSSTSCLWNLKKRLPYIWSHQSKKYFFARFLFTWLPSKWESLLYLFNAMKTFDIRVSAFETFTDLSMMSNYFEKLCERTSHKILYIQINIECVKLEGLNIKTNFLNGRETKCLKVF